MHFLRTAIVIAPFLAAVVSAPAHSEHGLVLRNDPTPPADPNTPADPTTPEPTTPTDPTLPADPTPGGPGGPGGPTTPADPTTPTDPTPTDPTPTTPTPATNQYFLYVDNLAADNSTASLHAEGNGTIAALGQFDAGAGVRWTQELLEVGYSAKVGEDQTLGGGYTINADGISVGAGIGVNGTGTSFSLSVSQNGTITASIFGDNLNCSVDGSKATCTNGN